MRFSYDITKKMVKSPGSQKQVMETLTMHAAPVEDPKGKTFDLELPSNRYADLASHLGVAREYAAAAGKSLQEPDLGKLPAKDKKEVAVRIETAKACPRYMACLFELGKKGSTPAWMKAALKDCGVRPISPVVDILNYVMLEVGQPMHAFDADKISGGITVRMAKVNEQITTIDGQSFSLTKEDLVIADDKNVQAIAGIKGGKKAEVSASTKRILVESANFDQVSIYNTSKRLKLVTDASNRFGHGMSPEGAELGMKRAVLLLEEIVGAKPIACRDVYPKKSSREIIGFRVDRFNSLIGTELKPSQIAKHLLALGFKKVKPVKKSGDDFLVEVPPLRLDIASFEDLAEEVVRMHGIDTLPARAPSIDLVPATEEDEVIFKDRVRNILTGVGFSETYASSFVDGGSKSAYEPENPIAAHKTHLRQTLVKNLKEQAVENKKYFDQVRIFEIGRVFDKKLGERTNIGIVAEAASADIFLELRGVVEQLLNGLGFTQYNLYPDGNKLRVEVSGEVVGEVSHLGKTGAAAEFNATRLLELEEGEFEYRPISKYPAVMRDLSLSFPTQVRVGEVLNAIEEAAATHARDVDLIDYYDPQHITFRIVFQSDERTLTDAEVNKEFDKITSHLKKKFQAEVR